MHWTFKGKHWHFGMKVCTGVDKDAGLIFSVETTADNVHDLTPAVDLLNGEEEVVSATKGLRNEKRWRSKPLSLGLPFIQASVGSYRTHPMADWRI
jgi:IS5 family transposase